VNKLFYLIAITVMATSCHVIQRLDYKKELTANSKKITVESLRLNTLAVKNDSLNTQGLMYDSASKLLKKDIAVEQLKIDSLAQLINTLYRKVNFKIGFQENYTDLKKIVSNVNIVFATNTSTRNSTYEIFEKRMNDALLGGEKKVLKAILNSASAQQEKEAGAIVGIENKKSELLSAGKVDSSTYNNIDTRLVKYKSKLDSLSNEIATLNKKLESPNEVKKEFTYIKARVLLIDSVVNKGAKTREYSIQMIEDGLAKNTKKLFSLAAFFGPGGYIIPVEKYNLAREYFAPIIDSLQKFSNKYESVNRTASVMIDGYADGTKISAGSKLYKTLADFMHIKSPIKQELNTALSALRAIEIRKFLDMLLKEKSTSFIAIAKVAFLNFETGMGEVLPDPTINNYIANDERRRIVLIYWSVLPD
jgi:hypothetical protein